MHHGGSSGFRGQAVVFFVAGDTPPRKRLGRTAFDSCLSDQQILHNFRLRDLCYGDEYKLVLMLLRNLN
jgi:hypothetical protein